MLGQILKSGLRRRGPIWVGLTGGLASGKSTTLKEFKRLGWNTISSDKIVAEIYERFGLTKEEILKRFGRDQKGIQRLEKWIHPKVKALILKQLKKSKKNSIVEVPLLFEVNFQKLFLLNIFIFALKAARMKRAVKRGMPKSLFELLDRRQLSAFAKASMADLILHNITKKRLKVQARRLAKILSA